VSLIDEYQRVEEPDRNYMIENVIAILAGLVLLAGVFKIKAQRKWRM
jgi:hypothetical protein